MPANCVVVGNPGRPVRVRGDTVISRKYPV
jgi:hypothetical protein